MRRQLTTTLFLLAPVALWAGVAAAQDTTQAKQNQYPQQNRDSASQQYNSANTGALSDDAVLIQLHQSNQMEIRAGRFAQRNAASAKVKAFGSRVVRDHSAADAKVVALAKTLGVTLSQPQPQGQDSTGQAELKQLATLRGAAFDTAFVNAMVDGHGKAVSMLEQAQTQVQSQELRNLIASTLPTIRQHLQTAQSLSGEVTTTSSSQ